MEQIEHTEFFIGHARFSEVAHEVNLCPVRCRTTSASIQANVQRQDTTRHPSSDVSKGARRTLLGQFCYFAILLFCYFAILLFCYFAILLFCYFAILLFCFGASAHFNGSFNHTSLIEDGHGLSCVGCSRRFRCGCLFC
jgi:hypothetical protein